MSKLSLTNSVDIVCNSLKIIKDNDLVDIFSLFLLKSEGADIVGLAPSTLNTLKEIADAIGNDSDFSIINNKIDLKMNISNVYQKVYNDNLFTSYFTKEQMTVSLNTKLNLNALDTYYNKAYIDGLFENTYTLTHINFLLTRVNKTDVV